MSLVCGCWDDPPEFHTDEWKTARKEHVCVECEKIIKIGEYYCRATRMFDGRWYHENNCEKCQDLAESMMSMGFCIYVGGLHEAHEEYIMEYNPPRLDGGKTTGVYDDE